MFYLTLDVKVECLINQKCPMVMMSMDGYEFRSAYVFMSISQVINYLKRSTSGNKLFFFCRVSFSVKADFLNLLLLKMLLFLKCCQPMSKVPLFVDRMQIKEALDFVVSEKMM
jgi:hypothetical protein